NSSEVMGVTFLRICSFQFLIFNLHFLALLLRGFLRSRPVAAVASPNSFQSVRLDLVSDKAAARTADADGNVLALLDPDTVSVVAPHKAIEISRRLNRDLHFVSCAGRVFA